MLSNAKETKRPIAAALVLTFVAVCALMHVVQPSLSPVDDAVSFYMNGRLGWLMGSEIVALGAGSLLVLANMRRRMGSDLSRAGLLLLAAWGASVVTAGLFPPDAPGHWEEPPSFSGAIHGLAAMLAFSSFPVAALLLSRRRGMLWGLAMLCAAATAVFFTCLAPVFQNYPPYKLGLAERVVLGLNICWLLAANRERGRAPDV